MTTRFAEPVGNCKNVRMLTLVPSLVIMLKQFEDVFSHDTDIASSLHSRLLWITLAESI